MYVALLTADWPGVSQTWAFQSGCSALIQSTWFVVGKGKVCRFLPEQAEHNWNAADPDAQFEVLQQAFVLQDISTECGLNASEMAQRSSQEEREA